MLSLSARRVQSVNSRALSICLDLFTVVAADMKEAEIADELRAPILPGYIGCFAIAVIEQYIKATMNIIPVVPLTLQIYPICAIGIEPYKEIKLSAKGIIVICRQKM
jgi:hypothetical protein